MAASSDAAAVLRGLNRLWELDFDAARLQRIGAGLGSDVPFFLTGGTARCGGRGDEVAPLADIPPLSLTIAVPRRRPSAEDRPDVPSTASLSTSRPASTPQRLVDKLAAGEPPSDDDVFNVFESVLFETMPLARSSSKSAAGARRLRPPRRQRPRALLPLAPRSGDAAVASNAPA